MKNRILANNLILLLNFVSMIGTFMITGVNLYGIIITPIPFNIQIALNVAIAITIAVMLITGSRIKKVIFVWK